jgi:hypothetical protein
MQRRWLVTLAAWLLVALAAATSTVTGQPQGTLTVAVATFGNERWLPHLYVGAEDIVLKPVWENLLSRDPKTGDMTPCWQSAGRSSMAARPGAFSCVRACASTMARS